MSNDSKKPFRPIHLAPFSSDTMRKAGITDISSLRSWKCPKCKRDNPMSSWWCGCGTKNPYK